MTFYGQIYKITYPDDPHYYYGLTKRPLHKRFHDHRATLRKGNKTDLYIWMGNLTDLNSVTIQSVEKAATLSELKNLERKYVDPNLNNPYCLNMIPGGGGGGGGPKGEANGKAKLTNAQAELIRELWLTTRTTLQEMSFEFGVTIQSIWAIAHNKNWVVEDYTPISKKGKNQFDPEERGLIYQEIRSFASEHQSWTGKAIADYFKMDPKYCRSILRGDQATFDPNWDPETWTYLRD